jgi:hypothetical protein
MRAFYMFNVTAGVCCVLYMSLGCVEGAYACDTGTVRDAAFNSVRDNYWIGMVYESSDTEAQALYDGLAGWLEKQGTALNIQVEHIQPEDAMYLRLRHGVATSPTLLPVAYFTGRHPVEQRPVVFHGWTPSPEVAMLEQMRDNKVLAAIREHSSDFWAVVLYSRGVGVDKRGEIEKTGTKWKQNHAPGIAPIIEFDRKDPSNRLLCAVAGIKENGEDWAGVVFGKGRLLLPALEGDDITSNELDKLINRITLPCTCLQQDMVLGIDLPMFWENPEGRQYTLLDAPVGYMEISLDDKLAPLFDEMPSGDKSINTVALTVLSVLGLIAVLALSVMYLRLRKMH